MSFLLSSQNVIKYLNQHGFDLDLDPSSIEIEQKFAKNFNLLLTLPDDRKLLVKQEPLKLDGQAVGEFLQEWRVQQFIQQFPELHRFKPSFPELLHFNPDNAIVVFNYLLDYCDLADFYTKQNWFPVEIAIAIGQFIGQIHASTYHRAEYQKFLAPNLAEQIANHQIHLAQGLERIGPEVFSEFPVEALKFFSLYQRYDSLGRAIAELSTAVQLCCLTHNDLRPNNILLHQDWETLAIAPEQPSFLRIIDWERGAWGDPALDMGLMIASYLQTWLNSLVISSSFDIQESLRLAMTPLEQLQPSITALFKGYFSQFPEILDHRPDFVKRTVQFAGLGLIRQINAMIQYQKSFGNMGVCMLQVAKSLLCRPEASIATVFGVSESTLIALVSSAQA
ncbi:aminoglycoside phosphotransferase family protein [Oculatella sp. LEGE 06141]|uniref:phosphotransferase family protein n=1 Tax=Oculatella sp. LEGE 06141 TaxID=1828648 RepID=UPI00187EE4E9|nr:aminoglycoside phosphotransferase family protein [Oculatella sp. LEGE 06141]MBE9180629.1 aminoglycoside phosphotransferase family protein [Oculatella sp. LEGE 06141]